MVSSSSRVKLLGQKMRNYRWSLTDLLPAIFKLFSPYLTPVPLGHEHGIDRTPETWTQVTLTLTFFLFGKPSLFCRSSYRHSDGVSCQKDVRWWWKPDQNTVTELVYSVSLWFHPQQITSEWQFRQKYGGKKGSVVPPEAKSDLIKTLHPTNLKTKQIPCLSIFIWFICRHMLCFSVHVNHGAICIHLDDYISRNSRIVVNVYNRLNILKVKGRGWVPVAHRRGQCMNFRTFLGWDVRLSAKHVM